MSALYSLASAVLLALPAPHAVPAGGTDGGTDGAAAAIPATKTIAEGRYVEARNASVYAGACHFNGEFSIRGREALLAWSFDDGSWNGVDLDGITVVAVVAGDANLSLPDTKRRSVLYVDRRAPLAARDAVVELLLARHGDQLGKVLDVETVTVSVTFEKDGYRVEIPKVAKLAGSKMPDRECCKMPFNVWYDPFVPLEKPIVGCSELFLFEAEDLGPVWSSEIENNAFLGRFRIGEIPKP